MQTSPLESVIPNWDSPTLMDFDTANAQEGKRIGGSKRLFVNFYNKTFPQIYATEVKINEKTGSTQVLKTAVRQVTKEFVKIIIPGDKHIVDAPAETHHKREHWRHYQAFRDGKTAPLGLPIDEQEWISPEVSTELRYLGVITVEQLADGSDSLIQQIPNGWEMREFARSTCRMNIDKEKSQEVNVLKAEIESSREVIAEMQRQMAEMRGMLLNSRGEEIAPREEAPSGPGSGPKIILETEVKRGRGRPPKEGNV